MSLSEDQKKALAAKRETLTLNSEIRFSADKLKKLFEALNKSKSKFQLWITKI